MQCDAGEKKGTPSGAEGGFVVRLSGCADVTALAKRLTAAHAAADAASPDATGANAIIAFPAYTERPYEQRGWTTFESAVSAEALCRVAYVPSLNLVMSELPPKMFEIDGDDADPHRPAQDNYVGGGDAKARIAGVEASIGRSFFTGKGDREKVCARRRGGGLYTTLSRSLTTPSPLTPRPLTRDRGCSRPGSRWSTCSTGT